MMDEINSIYTHKYDMLRNYLHLIVHEGLKLQPAENFEKQTNAPARITSLFMELLEGQFPIDAPENALKLMYQKSRTVSVSTILPISTSFSKSKPGSLPEV